MNTSLQRLISDKVYRCPRDLTVTDAPLRRVALIGSCLLGGWPDVIEAAEPSSPCDFILFNNASVLPSTPPYPISNYDFQVIQIPLRTILPEGAYFSLTYTDISAYERLFVMAQTRLRENFRAAMRWNIESDLLTFVCNFLRPQQNALGRLFPRYDLRNLVYFVEELNKALAEEIKGFRNCYLMDLDEIVSTYGRKYFQDDVVWHTNHGGAIGDGPADLDEGHLEFAGRPTEFYPERVYDFVQFIWAELVGMFRTVRGIDAIKLVIVDPDNTLWRGCGASVLLSPSDALEGWPLGVVEALGYLSRRGIYLGLISDHSESELSGIFSSLFGNRLRMNGFAFRKPNAVDKSSSIAAILNEAGLLPEEALVVNDDPREREAIQRSLAGIRTLGPSPYLWRRLLLWSPEIQVPGLGSGSEALACPPVSRESQKVSVHASHDSVAAGSKAVVGTIVRINSNVGKDPLTLPRLVALLNGEDVFKAIDSTWTLEECQSALSKGFRFLGVEVDGAFSPHNTIGVVVLKGSCIEQFVISQKYVGAGVEIAAVGQIMQILRSEGKSVATAILDAPNSRGPSRNVYECCGFVLGQFFPGGSTGWLRDTETPIEGSGGSVVW